MRRSNNLAAEFGSFHCESCKLNVKFEAPFTAKDHKCETIRKIRPNKRLRGNPPYRFPDEISVPRRRYKKLSSSLEKNKLDPERAAWLQNEVFSKIYRPEAIWCRYCGCEKASGFGRGPWVSISIKFVTWFC